MTSMISLVFGSKARGIVGVLACGRHCVLRQWVNRLDWSCLIIRSMFVKVVSFIADVMFSKVSKGKDHL